MTMTETTSSETGVFDRINAIRDALTVKRVFGDAYERDDTMIIPVAALRGAGGGGEGTGTDDANRAGSGAGMGFAVTARPLGVYVVKGGEVCWQPALDVLRLVLVSEAAVLVGLLLVRRALARRH